VYISINLANATLHCYCYLMAVLFMSVECHILLLSSVTCLAIIGKAILPLPLHIQCGRYKNRFMLSFTIRTRWWSTICVWKLNFFKNFQKGFRVTGLPLDLNAISCIWCTSPLHAIKQSSDRANVTYLKEHKSNTCSVQYTHTELGIGLLTFTSHG